MTKISTDSSLYHEAALDKLIQADQALANATELGLDAPHTTDAITVDWLQEIIGGEVPGAVLQELSVEDEHDGMTSRKKWSLWWNDAGREAGLPGALFAKATPPQAAHRVMLAVLHMDEAEALFYKTIQPEIPELAPQAFYAESYFGGRHLIVLDDLVAEGCTPFWAADHCGVDHVRGVARALATLHARYWDSERLSADLSWVRPRTRRYGWSWLRDMTHEVRQAFLAKADEEILPASLRPLLQLWDENSARVFDYWESLPQTVLHGDSHLGNTFAYPDGRAGLFDWQVMFRGCGLRDLAYFCTSAMSNDERRSHEIEVFDLYLDALGEQGVILDEEEAWNHYCLFILDRWDAGITSWVHGTYGHGGQTRSFQSVAGCLADNDVRSRLEVLLDELTS
jgi:hypothetical protein